MSDTAAQFEQWKEQLLAELRRVPADPAGSEHYVEGARNGYDVAVDRVRDFEPDTDDEVPVFVRIEANAVDNSTDEEDCIQIEVRAAEHIPSIDVIRCVRRTTGPEAMTQLLNSHDPHITYNTDQMQVAMLRWDLEDTTVEWMDSE